MKKEIIKLINSEKGIIRINKFTSLERNTKDVFEDDVDILRVVFNIEHYRDYSKDIQSRVPGEVINEIVQATEEAFEKAKNNYIKKIKNGYL